MTEDELIMLGDYCEDLLSQECFNFVAQQFHQQCFEHFMSSDTKEDRERVYARMGGQQDFLSHMRAYVTQRDAIYQHNRALSDEDAHIPGID